MPLEGVPGMSYGPVNEHGVICLFALMSKKLGFSIEQIRRDFPDCIARRRTGTGWEKVRIEFEYHAKSFRAHGHKVSGCDMVVCWENDWPDAPKGLEILDLRRRVEPRRVWVQSVSEDFWGELDDGKAADWSLPRLAKTGDLLLFWHCRPRRQLRHIAVVKENATPNSSWRWYGKIRLIAELEHPVCLDHLLENEQLQTSAFVRGNFQSRYDATPWWADLHRIITTLNPKLKKPLIRYFGI